MHMGRLILALFLLLMACVYFVNGSLAQMKRKETTDSGERKDLLVQGLTSSFCFMTCSGTAAWILWNL